MIFFWGGVPPFQQTSWVEDIGCPARLWRLRRLRRLRTMEPQGPMNLGLWRQWLRPCYWHLLPRGSGLRLENSWEWSIENGEFIGSIGFLMTYIHFWSLKQTRNCHGDKVVLPLRCMCEDTSHPGEIPMTNMRKPVMGMFISFFSSSRVFFWQDFSYYYTQLISIILTHGFRTSCHVHFLYHSCHYFSHLPSIIKEPSPARLPACACPGLPQSGRHWAAGWRSMDHIIPGFFWEMRSSCTITGRSSFHHSYMICCKKNIPFHIIPHSHDFIFGGFGGMKIIWNRHSPSTINHHNLYTINHFI